MVTSKAERAWADLVARNLTLPGIAPEQTPRWTVFYRVQDTRAYAQIEVEAYSPLTASREAHRRLGERIDIIASQSASSPPGRQLPPQAPCDIGLFGNDAAQLDLVDQIKQRG